MTIYEHLPLMNTAMVAEVVNKSFKVSVVESQIRPGYMQDEKKLKPRQPVWEVFISEDLIIYIPLMPKEVVDLTEFHPARKGDGYVLPDNLGYVYLSEINKENSKYSRGLCKGIRYYDLNVHVPGRQ